MQNEKKLMDDNGRAVARDIVRFVEFSKFKNDPINLTK